MLAAAAVAGLVLAWATKSHAISRLFDSVIDKATAVSGPVRDRGVRTPTRSDRGQATVELALVLPLLVLMLLALVQTALVARDQRPRAGRGPRRSARGECGRRRRAGGRRGAPHARRGRGGGAPRRTVSAIRWSCVVQYVDHTNLPLVGPLFPDVVLHATATMRAER